MRAETAINRLIRTVRLGPSPRLPKRRPVISEPADRFGIARARQALAYISAIVLPLVVAVAMIPIREDHGRITGLVLILPVLATALLGSTGPALAAAVVAGVAYDFFLTRPYYRFAIDDPDEIVAMVVIICVGAVVGVLSSRLARTTARDAVRSDELRHLVDFVRDIGRAATTDDFVQVAGAHLAALLGARNWRWHAGYHGSGSATLLDTGAVTSALPDLPADRAELPAEIEVPAGIGTHRLGCFILQSTPGNLVSEEERRTAAAIVTLFAAHAAAIDVEP